jgi:C_GCAxxG_C_C family probable redox protein
MSNVEKAVTLFERFNCAQSVFAACGPSDDLSEQMCLILAGPFGGGMGRMGETCGALTGALLVLGVRHGREMATNPAQARGPLYERVAALTRAFRERNGGLACRELTGCDLRTPEGQEQFKNRDLHHTLCRKLVTSAVELLEEGQGAIEPAPLEAGPPASR